MDASEVKLGLPINSPYSNETRATLYMAEFIFVNFAKF